MRKKLQGKLFNCQNLCLLVNKVDSIWQKIAESLLILSKSNKGFQTSPNTNLSYVAKAFTHKSSIPNHQPLLFWTMITQRRFTIKKAISITSSVQIRSLIIFTRKDTVRRKYTSGIKWSNWLESRFLWKWVSMSTNIPWKNTFCPIKIVLSRSAVIQVTKRSIFWLNPPFM